MRACFDACVGRDRRRHGGLILSLSRTQLIIATRFHYTLDVCIALYLTQRTFRFYFDAVRYPNLLRETPLYSLLRWMEQEDILAIEAEAFELVSLKA